MERGRYPVMRTDFFSGWDWDSFILLRWLIVLGVTLKTSSEEQEERRNWSRTLLAS